MSGSSARVEHFDRCDRQAGIALRDADVDHTGVVMFMHKAGEPTGKFSPQSPTHTTGRKRAARPSRPKPVDGGHDLRPL